jgi:hypothetical protein
MMCVIHASLEFPSHSYLATPPPARRLLGPWWQRKEGVPLDPPFPNVACHKVSLWTDVDLVPCLVVVGRAEGCFPGENSVAGVCTSVLLLAVWGGTLNGLAVHLATNGAPNAVRSNENISMGVAAVGEFYLWAGGVLGSVEERR